DVMLAADSKQKFFSCSKEVREQGRSAMSGFGPTPRPVDRGSLFVRSGHPALTHAQNIHVLLFATPGRQGTAHCDWCCDVPMSSFFEAMRVIGDGRSGAGVAESSAWMRCGGESAMDG